MALPGLPLIYFDMICFILPIMAVFVRIIRYLSSRLENDSDRLTAWLQDYDSFKGRNYIILLVAKLVVLHSSAQVEVVHRLVFLYHMAPSLTISEAEKLRIIVVRWDLVYPSEIFIDLEHRFKVEIMLLHCHDSPLLSQIVAQIDLVVTNLMLQYLTIDSVV